MLIQHFHAVSAIGQVAEAVGAVRGGDSGAKRFSGIVFQDDRDAIETTRLGQRAVGIGVFPQRATDGVGSNTRKRCINHIAEVLGQIYLIGISAEIHQSPNAISLVTRINTVAPSRCAARQSRGIHFNLIGQRRIEITKTVLTVFVGAGGGKNSGSGAIQQLHGHAFQTFARLVCAVAVTIQKHRVANQALARGMAARHIAEVLQHIICR